MFEKTTRENFDFVHLLSFLPSFCSEELHLKTIACMRIVNILNDCSATWHPPFLGLCGVWATTGELRPRNCRLLSPRTLHVLGCHCPCNNRVDVARIGTPDLRHWTRVPRAARSVRRSSFIVFAINLVNLKAVYSSRERYCVYTVTCGCSIHVLADEYVSVATTRFRRYSRDQYKVPVSYSDYNRTTVTSVM